MKQLFRIRKEFRFEAAHKLPKHDGKCARLHGHSWCMWVEVAGEKLQEEGPKAGMLMDFGDIKSYVQPLLENYLDHHYLNETLSLENPTSEKVASWVFRKLRESGLKQLVAVEIEETCTSACRLEIEGKFPGEAA